MENSKTQMKDSTIEGSSRAHTPKLARWPMMLTFAAGVYAVWLMWLAYVAWVNINAGNQ